MCTGYQDYFDATPCYLTVQNRELLIVDANRRFQDDFGDYGGRHCYQVYKHRSEKCEVCPVERTFQDGLPHSSREEVTTLDGRAVSVLVNTTPIRDAGGSITAVLEMSTDVTELSRLEQQLRDSQERYRLLFEEVPCLISIQDRNLRIVEANRLHRETFGTHYGCKCYRVYKHRDEACDPCVVKQTFADGQVHVHEEVVTSLSGERINVMVTTAPLRDRQGIIDLVIEMSADITQVRQLQSQLSSIGLIISSISHDLKGYLSGLDGGTYLVNTGLDRGDQSRVESGWEMVVRNVGHIRKTVLDILYFSKDREPDVENTDGATLVQSVVDQLGPKASALGVTLQARTDQSTGHLEVDVRAIRSMLTNLIDNGLDACRLDSRDVVGTVSVSAYGTDDQVQIEVADNGIGMSQEVREKAFTLFFSSKGTGGTGLGLFIANRIARAHGGAIELTSQVGDGSRFTVRLPRQSVSSQAYQHAESTQSKPEASADDSAQ